MLCIIIGIVLAGYAYRRGLRPRAGETVSPLFEGKYGRVFAGFTMILGFGIAALSQKPDWHWGSDIAIALGVWFWTMTTDVKKNGERVQEIPAAVGQAARRERLAWGIAGAIWLTAAFGVPAIVAGEVFRDEPGNASLAGLLWFGGMAYFMVPILLVVLISRILSPRQKPQE